MFFGLQVQEVKTRLRSRLRFWSRVKLRDSARKIESRLDSVHDSIVKKGIPILVNFDMPLDSTLVGGMMVLDQNRTMVHSILRRQL